LKTEKYKQKLGAKGEELAGEYLRNKGFEILEKNYKYKRKEIDLIVKDKNTVVFVEVKAGRSKKFGLPLEKVDLKKQKKIIEVAQAFLCENNFSDYDFRFDVVEIELEEGGNKINHIENAFVLTGDCDSV